MKQKSLLKDSCFIQDGKTLMYDRNCLPLNFLKMGSLSVAYFLIPFSFAVCEQRVVKQQLHGLNLVRAAV